MTRYAAAAGVAVALMLAAAAMIFFFAPTDALQGAVQRIFYVHVAAAIAAFTSFATVLIGSVLYLWRGSLRDEQAMLQNARVGGIQLHLDTEDGRLRRMGFEIELQLLQDHFRVADGNGKFQRARNVVQFERHAIERQPLHQLIQ